MGDCVEFKRGEPLGSSGNFPCCKNKLSPAFCVLFHLSVIEKIYCVKRHVKFAHDVYMMFERGLISFLLYY